MTPIVRDSVEFSCAGSAWLMGKPGPATAFPYTEQAQNALYVLLKPQGLRSWVSDSPLSMLLIEILSAQLHHPTCLDMFTGAETAFAPT